MARYLGLDRFRHGWVTAFDGLVGTHWAGRHEVSAGTCQGFTNR
jgi:hypothetical protein